MSYTDAIVALPLPVSAHNRRRRSPYPVTPVIGLAAWTELDSRTVRGVSDKAREFGGRYGLVTVTVVSDRSIPLWRRRPGDRRLIWDKKLSRYHSRAAQLTQSHWVRTEFTVQR